MFAKKGKEVDLCKPCACAVPKGSIRFVRANIDTKITCANCNRRRYGSTYELLNEKKEGILSK